MKENDALLCNRLCGLHMEGEEYLIQVSSTFWLSPDFALARLGLQVGGRSASLATYLPALPTPAACILQHPSCSDVNKRLSKRPKIPQRSLGNKTKKNASAT